MLLMSSMITTVLPTPAPPNSADLTALGERRDQVDDLDARLENLRLRVLIDQRWGGAVNRVFLVELHRALAIHCRARDVEDASEHALAHRHRDRRARIQNAHTTHETLGRGHRDRARHTGAKVLLHLEAWSNSFLPDAVNSTVSA
jgi:hypothetical protein